VLEPIIQLVLDGIDVAATTLFLLALWDGRQTRWLGMRCGSRLDAGDNVTRFIAQARQVRPRDVFVGARTS
jgi:hypothetical protein